MGELSLVERLRSGLPVCPFSSGAPKHDIQPNEACPVCGDFGDDRAFEAASKCNGQDGRILYEAAARIEALEAERAFLLARSSRAGSFSFSAKDRWTGMSSNALVEVAFGGKNDCLPMDGNDLSACYLTILRMPAHLRSKAVFDQLERGEKEVSAEGLAWARENAKWPDSARTALSEQEKGA